MLNLDDTLARIESLGTEKMRAQHRKRGASDENTYGVRMGDLRKVAKELKKHPELAQPLWGTGIIDASPDERACGAGTAPLTTP